MAGFVFPSETAVFDPQEGLRSATFLGSRQRTLVGGTTDGYLVGYNVADTTKVIRPVSANTHNVLRVNGRTSGAKVVQLMAVNRVPSEFRRIFVSKRTVSQAIFCVSVVFTYSLIGFRAVGDLGSYGIYMKQVRNAFVFFAADILQSLPRV